MLALSDLDIGISDGIKLLEYNDFQHFVDVYSKKKRKKEIVKKLDFVNILLLVHNSLRSKKGQSALSVWQRKLYDELNDMTVEENGTVFEKLRLRKNRKTTTVFERLKARKK